MSTLHTYIQTEERSPICRLAKGALQAEAERRGLDLKIEIDPGLAPESAWEASSNPSDAVLLVGLKAPAQPAATTHPVLSVDLARLARETGAVLDQLFPDGARLISRRTSKPDVVEPAESAKESKFLVGVTSCPTGIAHTFMAAKALAKAAEEMGFTMKVETRGSVGAKNELTPEEIEKADAVIVAADAAVETKRFAGKRLLETGTKPAIKDSKALIREALTLQPVASAGGLKMPPKKERKGVYKHLMTGVSNMLPLVVAGGLLIALAFAVGGIYAGDAEGTFGWALMQIGGSAAFALFIPVLAGFIAFSIADRPGLTPGLIGGMLASQIGAGFLGGLAAGFFAGYLTKFLNNKISLPESLQGLKPVLILPLLTSLVVGLAMIFVIGPPVKFILDGLSAWLNNMQEGSALVMGLLLGGMMAFDMGGPVNKSAYTFGVGLLASQIYAPMAAVMAAGMVPPLACALAANLFRKKFTDDERQASKAAAVLGISFITEGAIPYAAADPVRVIPCNVLGAAVTGGLSMLWGCKLVVPHGGIFVLAIPNAITQGLAYVGAILAGTAVATVALYFAKRPVAERLSAASA
ncbi:fructose-specific PTS transporter subunit EIIC [Coraliomargarita parva]|uniref:fructose-specific PTS transporter subunit EIIC n=1 Tax=Coraliomargarita parva TaxID=3014050 RepID=UPI0022B51971|nr:fructose-specific PTS transporter subunit EIIC [Coraliomargarita parva]